MDWPIVELKMPWPLVNVEDDDGELVVRLSCRELSLAGGG